MEHNNIDFKKGGMSMPELKCTVQTCGHNQQFLCNLNEIHVGGDRAAAPKETCCDSFRERKEGSYSNVTGLASDTSRIDCLATECMYNEHHDCHAGKISVEGSNADHSEGTECATFQHK